MTAERYTRTAMVLHWLIAAAILGQIAFGWYLQKVPRKTPERTVYVNFHKSTGMLIGVLVLARIAWRLRHPAPPLPASMPAWERRAAHANHVLLYACMIVMPLAGYIASNFSRFGVKFFNAIDLPPWGVEDRAIYGFFNGVHVATSYVLVGLIALHIAAAAKHAIFPQHAILRRMLPLALLLLVPVLAIAAPFAYVSNEGSGTVSVIDTASDTVVASIQTGGKPRGAAAGADGRLYVSDQPNNRLVVIDLKDRRIAGSMALGVSPEGVGRSADGRWIAAASEQSNSVTFVDTRVQREVFIVKVKGENPEHAVFSPDGRFVYVSAEDGDTVEVIDFARRAQVAQVKVGARPRGIGFLPDGSRAYVAAENADTVFAIDAHTHKVLASIPAGKRSNGIAVHPDGRRVYVSNGGDGSVSVIDTSTNSIVATISVGQRPWNMALTPDGAKLYVANGRSGTVSVIDTAKNTKLRDVTVGKLPWGVVVH